MMKALQPLRTLAPVHHQQHGYAERMPDFEIMIRIAEERCCMLGAPFR